MIEITNHILDEQHAKYVESPNHGGKQNMANVDTIVIHYTAGPSAQSAINTFKDPNARFKPSAHLVIDFNGGVIQMVPFNVKANHAGESEHLGRKWMNNYSIGIEIVNAGNLKKVGNRYQAWYGRFYNEDEVIVAKHKNRSKTEFWQIYTEEQIEIVGEICKALISCYDIKYIVGHDDIAPNRKTDPGPAFPMVKIQQLLLGNPRNDEETDSFQEGLTKTVNATTLNIRREPNLKGKRIVLYDEQQVQVVEESGGWAKVRTMVEGWVSSKYLK
jgi:N-acetylmuramoyl-L-alanine amidase